MDKESSPEHYDSSYHLKKKITCEEILLSEIKNYNLGYLTLLGTTIITLAINSLCCSKKSKDILLNNEYDRVE